jgi:ribonuclease Z
MNSNNNQSSLKIGGIAILIILVIAGALYSQRSKIVLQLAQRMVASSTSDANPIAQLSDGLHVGLCGAGSPFPDPRRSGPCTVVVAGKRMFVFDTGGGAARNISRMQLNPGQIEAVFFTHYHSDHIDGLGELMLVRWIQGNASAPLAIHGPQGLLPVLNGFMQAYTADAGWRSAHHGPKVAPPSGFGGLPHVFELPADTGRTVLIADPDLEVVAFKVKHGPIDPAVGYRIRYKDRTVVISGDTSKSDAIEREAKGVDLLVHEAQSIELLKLLQTGFKQAGRVELQQVMTDIENYHTTPEQAAETAQASGVRMLVMNHIVPPLPSSLLEETFRGKSGEIYRGPIHLGQDFDWFSLPAGTTRIESQQRKNF